MIGYLRGKVAYISPDYVLLDVNGVGYEIVCSGAAFSRLSGVKNSEEGEVYTYLQVKEDGVTLYGFADPKEKALFLRLISVQGVGAKMAIGVLSTLRPEELMQAIATADVKRLSAAKGLGKKTAERIVLELHGKISVDELIEGSSEPTTTKAAKISREDEDAISALTGLGFTRQESARAVERAKEAGARTVEEIISTALRGM